MYRILLVSIICFSYNVFGQKIKTQKVDSTSNWREINKLNLDITQISFINWNAGGNNSISGIFRGQFVREFSKKNVNWKSELLARYGLNKQQDREIRKTDDQFQINSTFGYRTDTIYHWYFSSKFNFQTQFYNGYNYPNNRDAISKPFAPAYVFLGIGAEYNRKDLQLNLYISPLTQKTTLVFDEELSNQGAFGVKPAVFDPISGALLRSGAKSRTELGFLITNQWEHEIWKNINLDHRISLYSDYINNFGNVDVDWQILLEMTVNEYVKASLGTHLIYDDDIKAKEEINGTQVTVGPKIQLKQILGVGVSYSF